MAFRVSCLTLPAAALRPRTRLLIGYRRFNWMQRCRPAARQRTSIIVQPKWRQRAEGAGDFDATPASGDAMNSIPSPGERAGHDGLSEELNKLRRDVLNLKDSLARRASQAGSEAAKTVRNLSQTAVSQAGSAASGAADSELVSSAKEHAKTFASELQGMARRNPLGTIVGALVVGVVIGMISHGRS